MAIPSSYSTEELKKCFITAACDNNLPLLKESTQLLVKRGVGKVELAEILTEPLIRNVLFDAVAAAKGRLDVCTYLVEELNFDVNVQDYFGDTPLHVSTLKEDLVTSLYLLQHGADPNKGNHDRGLTPFHYATASGRPDLMCLLISKGANVDAQSRLFGTPLQAAAIHGKDHIVELLLDNQANPNLANPNTMPALMNAIKAKSFACVRALLECGADPNAAGREMTPLTAAAQGGQNDIIKLLLRMGADPNVTNFYNFTPIEYAAVDSNHAGVMALFPATKPIPHFPNWSVRGILEYFKSGKIKEYYNTEEKFLEAKSIGNEAVKKGHYLDAINWYVQALSLKPTDAAVLSNRSLCWARLDDGKHALEDAMACMKLRDDWPKAHYRAGIAFGLLKDHRNAEKEFEIAIKLDPENKELQDAYRAVRDLIHRNGWDAEERLGQGI